DYHCGLIGYQVKKKLIPQVSSNRTPHSGVQQPVTLGQSSPAVGSKKAALGRFEQLIPDSQVGRMKRKENGDIPLVKNVKAKLIDGKSQNVQKRILFKEKRSGNK
ncbi:hypothetical protein Prudu_016857, partial [Prunus dulcis]